MPAPSRNANALQHGLAITVGTLPPRFGKLVAQVRAFSELLKARVVETKGELTVEDALLVQSAARIERHCQLCLKWLRDAYKTLSPAERLNHSRELANATVLRDKTIKQLGLSPGEFTRDPADAEFSERLARAIAQRSTTRTIDATTAATTAPASADADTAADGATHSPPAEPLGPYYESLPP